MNEDLHFTMWERELAAAPADVARLEAARATVEGRGDAEIPAWLNVAVMLYPHRLSRWEQSFALDVSGRYVTDDELSTKQRAVALRIMRGALGHLLRGERSGAARGRRADGEAPEAA